MKLVLIRHGESEWNRLNLFTGWTDVPLSEKGREEAAEGGRLLKSEGYDFDLCYTSYLQRAIHTLNLVLEQMDRAWLPVEKDWRLNERHYGALQGLNKAETAAKYGEEQVLVWRRSFDVPPPALEEDDERNPKKQAPYRNVDPAVLPLTESLAITIERVMPYFNEVIRPQMAAGKRVLIAAHGNSLRALVKVFDGLSDEEIIGVNIPTGVPLVYEFSDDFTVQKKYYLGDEKLFYHNLDSMMELVSRQLLDRYEIQARKKVRNFPFLMGQGVWIDSDKLGPDDEVREVLKHGTLSIGFIGLAETLVALYGHHHGESAEMQEKGLAIMQYMYGFCAAKSQDTGMNFTLLATPAEGLSGRFLRMDQKRYGKIPGVTDRDYYTNSFHVPVYYPLPAYDKIQIEAPYHALTPAGHITYVELDGDTAQNLEAFMAIVRCMHDAGVGYGSINHPVDRDPVCGYVGIIHDVCPRCGRREGEEIPMERLEELQKKYPGITEFAGLN